jgi:adenosylhomocysteine nucleosidase
VSAVPHLGILAGLQSEARCISSPMPAEDRPRVTIALSGARLSGAQDACATLIAAGATHLLSFGLAGGLDPALPPGTLLLPDRLLLPDGTERPVDGPWHAALAALFDDLHPVIGRHLGADIAIGSAAEKAALFARTAARAVDMESHVLALAAVKAGRPFAMLRVVCDGAGETLPPAALHGIKPDGSTDILGVLWSLFRQPGQIRALTQLARSAKAAERVLGLCGARIAQIGSGASRVRVGAAAVPFGGAGAPPSPS